MNDFSFGLVPIFQKTKNIDDTYFLLIEQTGGFWSLPKGHPEKNESESEIETATRELLEETGIVPIKIIDDINSVEEYTWNDYGTIVDKTVKFFPCFCADFFVQIDNKEISDAKWLKYQEALDLITYKETKQVLEDTNKWLLSLDR